MQRIKWSIGVTLLCFIGTLITMTRWMPASPDSFELGTDVGKPCQSNIRTCCDDAAYWYDKESTDSWWCTEGDQNACYQAVQDHQKLTQACNGCANCSKYCGN